MQSLASIIASFVANAFFTLISTLLPKISGGSSVCQCSRCEHQDPEGTKGKAPTMPRACALLFIGCQVAQPSLGFR